MKANLTCSIVQDILPNYIENLTSEETNIAMEEHLNICDDCKQVYEQMKTHISSTVKIPKKELKFFKKIKITKIIAAVLSIILALTFSYLLYNSEYKYRNDKAELSLAITENTSQSKHPLEAYVLETKEMDGMLIVTFKDKVRNNINGTYIYSKGLNQRYRLVSGSVETSDYSSIIQVHQVQIKKQPYYVINGYNLSDEIKSYGLDFNAYTSPGTLAKDRVRKSIKFEVKNQQFLEIYKAEELETILKDSVEETLYYPRLWETSMYDADGMEITDKFKNLEDMEDKLSYGMGTEDIVVMIYVLIAIIMGVGFVFTRYFLTD